MKKKSAIIMISITILASLTGCRLTDIDDVYSMADIEDEKKTTVVVDNKESKWHDDNKYYTIPEGVDIPPMVNMDDTINETSNKNKLECKIEEAYVTNDFTDVYLYEDSESIEQLIIFLNKMKKNEYIDEAANICSSPKGIDWQMIIFRLNITNTGNEDSQFLTSDFNFYDIKYDNNNLQYNTIHDNNFKGFFIKPDGWGEHEFCRATIKAKESREIILLCFVEKYKVTRYRGKNVTGYKYVYEDVETDGLMLDNDIYIGTNHGSDAKTGSPEIWNEDKLLKLDFTYSDKLK